MQIASEALKGRVFEVSLADLQKVIINTCCSKGMGLIDRRIHSIDSRINVWCCLRDDATCLTDFLVLLQQNEEDAYRKMRLRVEDVQGRNCLTNFWVSTASQQSDCQPTLQLACCAVWDGGNNLPEPPSGAQPDHSLQLTAQHQRAAVCLVQHRLHRCQAYAYTIYRKRRSACINQPTAVAA